MENQDIEGTARLLQKNWDLTPPQDMDWETLRQALVLQLGHMMAHDVERLVQSMYRLDVNEGKFHAAMALPTANERAVALAQVVLEREMQRLATWRKYSNPRNDA